MQLGFHDFKVLFYPEHGRPVFAVRKEGVSDVHCDSSTRSHLIHMDTLDVIPLYVDKAHPGGDWTSVEYRFGKHRVIGYYKGVKDVQ